MDETILRRAAFDPKLTTYWFWQGVLFQVVTVIGLPFLPVWCLGFGRWVGRKQFERLECVLTDRALQVRSGFVFRAEKTVPLDKIQDLSLHEGPVLRWLGLASLKIETAGSSAAQGMADANLVGVVDAPAFRDAVLAQRDVVTDSGGAALRASAPATESAVPAQVALSDAGALGDVRDSLLRIERLLERALDERGA